MARRELDFRGLGRIYGGLLCLETYFDGGLSRAKKKLDRAIGREAQQWLSRVITFQLVTFAWIFFRARTFRRRPEFFRGLFKPFNGVAIWSSERFLIAGSLIVGLMVVKWFRGRSVFERLQGSRLGNVGRGITVSRCSRSFSCCPQEHMPNSSSIFSSEGDGMAGKPKRKKKKVNREVWIGAAAVVGSLLVSLFLGETAIRVYTSKHLI